MCATRSNRRQIVGLGQKHRSNEGHVLVPIADAAREKTPIPAKTDNVAGITHRLHVRQANRTVGNFQRACRATNHSNCHCSELPHKCAASVLAAYGHVEPELRGDYPPLKGRSRLAWERMRRPRPVLPGIALSALYRGCRRRRSLGSKCQQLSSRDLWSIARLAELPTARLLMTPSRNAATGCSAAYVRRSRYSPQPSAYGALSRRPIGSAEGGWRI